MTLSTSATKRKNIGYLAATLFCAVFGGVYELFSHEIYSKYMIFAFMIPLIGWGLDRILCLISKGLKKDGDLSCQLLAGAVVWLTLGSLFLGALQIYGTTNRLSSVFAIAGGILLALALLTCFCGKKSLIKDNTDRQPAGQGRNEK